jgi:RHS repeat-associated protein
LLAAQYDDAGNVVQIEATIDGTADFVNNNQADNAGRMIQATQAGVTGGSAVASKQVDLSFNPDGQFSTIARYADSAGDDPVATSQFGYDGLGRLTSLTHAQGTTTLAAYMRQYDLANDLTQEVSVDGTASYSYDPAGQLTGATYTGGQAAETYSYDPNGNRTNTGYATGTDNELLSDGTFTYTYDAEGNRASRTRISSAQADDYAALYTWDHRNRLTSVTLEDNSGNVTEAVTYTYDIFNRWIGETITTGETTTQTRFVYDGNQIVMRFDGMGSGSLQANSLSDRYLWGPAVDQLVADEQLQTTPQVVWSLGDSLNTVRDLATCSNGTTMVVNHRVFSAYGELLRQTSPQTSGVPATDCLFAYTGRALDETTGLQNNGNRWYDGKTGRWLSEDPIGFLGGLNLYEYVGDAPLRGVDPTGEDVYIESTTAAGGCHWQICVDTWGDGCSRKTGKYCISFAGNRGAWCQLCGKTCPCGGGAPGLRPVTAPSTMPAGFPTNPAAKGQVYPSTSPALKEIVRTPHTCEEDERILIWLASLVGVHGDYAALGGFNCRDFSQLIYESVPKTLYPEWPRPNPPSFNAPGLAPPAPEYPDVFEETR